MESEDLADLLERELALLDDTDDTEDENTYNEDFLNYRTNDEAKDETIDEDFNQLLLSAQTLPNLRNVDETAPAEVEACMEDCEELTVLTPTEQLPANYPTEHIQSPVVTELTEEEKKIISDLMELMIESVERVAPILERTELRPLLTTPSTLTLVETPVLTIISDDEQLTQHLPELEASAEHNDRKVEIDLINHQLQNEARLEREARIASLQHNDQVVWDETNQFKQAIEKEKLKREERQRKREAAKLEARREKAAVSFLSFALFAYSSSFYSARLLEPSKLDLFQTFLLILFAGAHPARSTRLFHPPHVLPTTAAASYRKATNRSGTSPATKAPRGSPSRTAASVG